MHLCTSNASTESDLGMNKLQSVKVVKNYAGKLKRNAY